MASPTKVSPGISGGLAPGGALTHLPHGRKRRRGWVRWLVVFPLLLLAFTYLLGRTVEPFRANLSNLPAVGGLFTKPVWPILWNKPADSDSGIGAAPGDAAGAPAPGTSPLEDSLAARMAAVEVREMEVRRHEEELRLKEEALRQREIELGQQEARLGDEIKLAQLTRLQLQGEQRTEMDRVEVIREMRTSSVIALFTALDDAEAIRLLSYMEPAEIAKILAGLEPGRAARLLYGLERLGVTVQTR